MTKFWAFTHTGEEWEFLGDCWEDGAISTDDRGNPTRDANGNTIASYTANAVDPEADAHWLRDYYAGDEPIRSIKEFRAWLEGEAGLTPEEAARTLAAIKARS